MKEHLKTKPFSEKKIAIVADWLIDFGWAELVLSHLLELFPEADIYTSVSFMEHPMLKGRKIYTSWLQKIPFFNKKHKLSGVLRPWAFRSFDLSKYDLVLCSSSAESKQVSLGKWRQKNQSTPVIVYCHTPIRYYWSHAKEYEDMMEFGVLNPLVKYIFRVVKSWMQKVDKNWADAVDYFIANSKNTQDRIHRYYKKESEVIYPGIDNQEQKSTKNTIGNYYISVGRCIPYKKFDLLVDTFNKNKKYLILCTATDTPLFRELKKKSKPNIKWKFRVSNEEKNSLIANAQAFLFPPEEDFGLVPLEAMSIWTPIIAYGKWGALETVIDGKTGIFFTPQTPEALNEAIERFEKLSFEKQIIRKHAETFSKEQFQEKILTFIKKYVR